MTMPDGRRIDKDEMLARPGLRGASSHSDTANVVGCAVVTRGRLRSPDGPEEHPVREEPDVLGSHLRVDDGGPEPAALLLDLGDLLASDPRHVSLWGSREGPRSTPRQWAPCSRRPCNRRM